MRWIFKPHLELWRILCRKRKEEFERNCRESDYGFKAMIDLMNEHIEEQPPEMQDFIRAFREATKSDKETPAT